MGPLATPCVRAVLAVTGAALALACGSPEPTPAPEATAANEPAARTAPDAKGNTPPVIDAVTFEPEVPVPGRPLRAVVRTSDADGDEVFLEYTWRIDGRDPGEKAAGHDLDLADAKRGQTVGLVVVASDGRSQSDPYEKRFELENRPPEVVQVDVEPGREVVVGTPIVALASGSDPDGDALIYRYAWTVNGRDLRETGALLETQRMRRGDEVRLRVTADDGEVVSPPVELPPILVVNAPPRVVSVPPADLADGSFRYAVAAEDPDDTHVEFRLEGAPAGMQIDPYSGLVTWTPTPEQAGVHAVTVFAEDLHEGVGQQEFEVRVTAPEQEGAPPAEEAP